MRDRLSFYHFNISPAYWILDEESCAAYSNDGSVQSGVSIAKC